MSGIVLKLITGRIGIFIIMFDWKSLKLKKTVELENKNTHLFSKVERLENENADLKQSLAYAETLLKEYKSRLGLLRSEISVIGLVKTVARNNSSNGGSEIKRKTVKNERGAGRKSRADKKVLAAITTLKKQGLSYQKIADMLTEATGEKWSKSTVGYIAQKHCN